MLSSKIRPFPTARKPKSASNKLDAATSNVTIAAELLLQLHSIADNEMMAAQSSTAPLIPVPQKLVEAPVVQARRVRPSILAPRPTAPRNSEQPRLHQRSRLVSMDADEDYYEDEPTCITPTTPRGVTTIQELSIDQSCLLPLPVWIETTDEVQKKRKVVGRTLPEGVVCKGTLRKKFSWKSFPELETYLVNHRAEYLQFSSSLNYTKAQKNYNNKLTQGLLDLAASVGYKFEGFSFAAVRDRIRCFYKSYVQATKKKKRSKRSLTM